MLNKKISSKLLVISITVLASVALCMCAIIGTSKTADAKANPSNDFSLTFECEPQYNLIGFYKSWDYNDATFKYADEIKSFDYWTHIKDGMAGMGHDCNVDFTKSYYQLIKPSVANEKYLSLQVVLFVNIPDIRDEPFEYGTILSPAIGHESQADAPWSLNGKTISEEPQPLSENHYDFKAGNFKQNISILGNVIDEAGNGIDGAIVSLSSETPTNAVPAPVTTVNGAFTFEDVDPAILPAILNVEKDGYTFEPVRITADDVKDGKITVASIVAKTVEVKPATEVAQTGDSTSYLAFALIVIAICGCGLASKKLLVK